MTAAGMADRIPPQRIFGIGLLVCGLTPLALLAAFSVRTAGQLAVLIFAILLVCVGSFFCSRALARSCSSASSANTNLDAHTAHLGKMADMGQLAAEITHELNNPLQLILSQAAWIEELLGDEEQSQVKNLDEYQKSVAGIKQQVARATRITSRVLGYARQDDEEAASVHINPLVEETWAFLEKKARDHNISHAFQLGQNLPPVLTSGHQVQQVLLNLMGNALDAAGEHGEISVRTSLAGNHICIEVSDNGPGMPDAVLKQIWQPFFTTKEQGKGTGLGLAISRQIVSSLGGELTAHNKTGETGAVFTVKIPINQGATTSTM